MVVSPFCEIDNHRVVSANAGISIMAIRNHFLDTLG